jgi:hypothetical protein
MRDAKAVSRELGSNLKFITDTMRNSFESVKSRAKSELLNVAHCLGIDKKNQVRIESDE